MFCSPYVLCAIVLLLLSFVSRVITRIGAYYYCVAGLAFWHLCALLVDYLFRLNGYKISSFWPHVLFCWDVHSPVGFLLCWLWQHFRLGNCYGGLVLVRIRLIEHYLWCVYFDGTWLVVWYVYGYIFTVALWISVFIASLVSVRRLNTNMLLGLNQPCNKLGYSWFGDLWKVRDNGVDIWFLYFTYVVCAELLIAFGLYLHVLCIFGDIFCYVFNCS